MSSVLQGFTLLALMILETTCFGSPKDTKTIDVTSYGARPDSGQDATVPFRKAIEALRAIRGPSVLKVAPGRYDFHATEATRKRCYFSNATEPGSDAIRTVAIDLSGLHGVTIEGQGARFLMHGKMTMVVADGSSNLMLKNLTFDFARPTVSEMTAVEKGDGYWVGRVHPDSWYRLKGHRIQWYGENWAGFHNLTQHYDPATKTTWRGDDPTQNATSITDMGDRRLKFEVPPDSLNQVVVGRVYQFRDVTRDECGMWFNRCRNVSMTGVTVRSMAGFGMLFQYCQDVSLQHLEVAPNANSGRTCASAADILHFSGCRGHVMVRDCRLTSAHDDAINVHGTYLQVVYKPSERQVTVRFMHPQTWGFPAFQAGDEIEFVRSDTLLGYASAKVTELQLTNDPHEQVLTLDRPVPNDVALRSDVIENVTWTPSVDIVACTFETVPTRAILVTTRRPVRIERNTFLRIPMPSVLISDDAHSWFESGPVRDVQIKDNRFFECAGPVIQIDPQIGAFAGPVHRNIAISGNEFEECSLPLLSARAVDRLSFTHNNWNSKEKANTRFATQTSECTHVTIQGNNFK